MNFKMNQKVEYLRVKFQLKDLDSKLRYQDLLKLYNPH